MAKLLKKRQIYTYFFTYLIIYLTVFYTSLIGMCEITYFTYVISGCITIKNKPFRLGLQLIVLTHLKNTITPVFSLYRYNSLLRCRPNCCPFYTSPHVF